MRGVTIRQLQIFSTAAAHLSFARTSEQPCFSVIAMPTVMPAFCAAGTLRGS